MNNLERRVVAIERGKLVDDRWRPVLDALPTADLERLEGLLMRVEAGEAERDLSPDDLRFLEQIAAMGPDHGG